MRGYHPFTPGPERPSPPRVGNPPAPTDAEGRSVLGVSVTERTARRIHRTLIVLIFAVLTAVIYTQNCVEFVTYLDRRTWADE